VRLLFFLLLVFMAGALGGWFGFRFAARESAPVVAEPASAEKPPGTDGGSPAVEARLEALEERVAAVEAGALFGAEEDDLLAAAPPEPEWTAAEKRAFEARAAGTVTLTDREGRELVCEILGTREDVVVVRRIADRRQFEVPVDRLAGPDQEFVRYLAGRENESGGEAPPGKAKEAGEPDWTAIFGAMEGE
jgi:hypothetical protein